MAKDKTKICYYDSETDDFVDSGKQDCKVPENYRWIHTNLLYRVLSACVFGTARFFSFFFCRLGLHVHIHNRALLRQCRRVGYFVYGNHTQMIGDVFTPSQVLFPKRYYVIASPANLGIPVLGKILPTLGALPIPEGVSRMKQLMDAIQTRIAQKHCVVIYPEAHVWPYYTGIRPFSATSFRFPVDSGAPSYAMTTTYHKRKWGNKPRIDVYIDGPFYPDETLPRKQRQSRLHDEISTCMTRRSESSSYAYIRYEKREETP